MKTRAKAFFLGGTLFIGGLLAGQAIADQPRMTEALGHLQRAEASRVRADNDKGGHRARALQLIRQAQGQVREGIQHDRHNGPGRRPGRR